MQSRIHAHAYIYTHTCTYTVTYTPTYTRAYIHSCIHYIRAYIGLLTRLHRPTHTGIYSMHMGLGHFLPDFPPEKNANNAVEIEAENDKKKFK